MSRNKKPINIIVHMPTDPHAIEKLQEITNNFYVERIEHRLRESTLTLKQKKELIDFLIESHKDLPA